MTQAAEEEKDNSTPLVASNPAVELGASRSFERRGGSVGLVRRQRRRPV